MANLRARRERLEAMTGGAEVLSGLLLFYPGRIFLDGKSYTSIEDLPQEIRSKFPGLEVGRVTDQYGHTVIITGESDWPEYLIIPQEKEAQNEG